MAVTRSFEHRSSGELNPELITGQVDRLVRSAGISQGLVQIFLPGSGAALLTVTCPQGDLTLAREVVREARQLSEHPHLLSALLGTSLSFPVMRQQLPLATWQEILLVDFLPEPRWHQIQVQILGERA